MSAHPIYKMFKFGCITFAVIDDVIIFIACSTPKSMDILGDNLANIHISVGSILGTWMGNGNSMMRWGWGIIIIIVIIVVIIISSKQCRNRFLLTMFLELTMRRYHECASYI